MGLLRSIYQFLITRGISDKHDNNNRLTSLLNKAALYICLGAVLGALTAIFFTKDSIDLYTNLFFILVYSIVFILHHYHYIQQVKFYFLTMGPLLVSMIILFVGGTFGQDITFVGAIMFTNYVYRNQPKLRNGLIGFQILLYVLPTVYTSIYQPILGLMNYPYDEIITFFFGLGCFYTLFSLYEEDAKKHIDILNQKNKKLKQKTDELERFNYIASHDLKSPLNNIMNFLGLMRKDLDKVNYNKLPVYLDYAESGAHQMNELIEGVLEISKTTSNEQIKGHFKTIDLNLTCQKAIANIHTEIKNKSVIVNVDKLPEYLCHETDFIIIFQNLMQNGIKYNTSKQPIISISSQSTEQEFIILVKDNGIGIPEKYYKQIFEYFKRLHNQTDYPGTGLGLGLCKKIIDKYNGQISVTSVENCHSTFKITLPITAKKPNNSKSTSPFNQQTPSRIPIN